MPGLSHPHRDRAYGVRTAKGLLERPERGRISVRIRVGTGSPRDPHELSRLILAVAERAIAPSRVMVVGDVGMRLIWMCGDGDRPRSVHGVNCPDVLSSVLTAVCGPRGLLVHGGQVRSVSCRRVDWSGTSSGFACVLRFSPRDWLWKSDLQWVALTDTLCLPLNRNLPPAMQHLLLDVWEGRVDSQRACSHLAADDEVRACAGPGLRPVRRSHLRGFDVLSADEVRARIAGAQG